MAQQLTVAGTISVLDGGKFANGAAYVAFSMVVNQSRRYMKKRASHGGCISGNCPRFEFEDVSDPSVHQAYNEAVQDNIIRKQMNDALSVTPEEAARQK